MHINKSNQQGNFKIAIIVRNNKNRNTNIVNIKNKMRESKHENVF